MKDITFIVTHFFDFYWTELCVRQICKTTEPSAIREILIINQDRLEASRERIKDLDSRIRVLEYPKSEAHFAVMGHDHPAVLNEAIYEAQGKYICIFDSDAHPFSSDWLSKCDRLLQNHDAVLAEEVGAIGFSHPCFMMIKKEHRNIPLVFDDKLFTEDVDTGRFVANQLRNANQRVYLAKPMAAFSGYWGSIYLDSIYHHGHGSFHGATRRLTKQITWANKYFQIKVVHFRSYDFSFYERIQYRIISLLHPNPIFLLTRLTEKAKRHDKG
jgi:hypothetical protein